MLSRYEAREDTKPAPQDVVVVVAIAKLGASKFDNVQAAFGDAILLEKSL